MARAIIEGKATIIGKAESSYDFKDRKSGEQRSGSGIELYLSQPHPNGEGVIAERAFIGNQKDYFDVANKAKLGDAVFVSRNRYNDISRLEAV